MANPILVLAEHLRGSLTEVTFEMLGAARALAQSTGAPVQALLVGSGVEPLAAQLGAADSVLLVDRPDLANPSSEQVSLAAEQAAGKTGAGLIFVAGTNVSTGIGTLLAARAKLPLVNFCREIKVADGRPTFVSQLFGGKVFAEVRMAGDRGVVSLYPGAFRAEAGRADKAAPVERCDLQAPPAKVRFRRFVEPETGDVDITRQDVLVAVGRGIQSQDNLALAEELAQVLKGAVCASRPVIDQGWLPLSRQVGKSGMSVKPRLYIALGISGAPEHWEGMQSSRLIIAFNTDPKAPIFDGSQYGVCGDLLDYVPALTEKLKARSS
ncbi:MAG TPA: electron transfer flavoprotein subunit alpha/FixB family protein [Candidatus Paceibacterota bacterium]|nr:electron transfer flavoprotein subunit alpha/FixB family protein [Verrucomicrobiota bacterium]HOX03881.1 electron transfer flavoprotein subunit alpha/FixB family protein [Verrucomicrobiota bacterium]HRZ46758.1 electron transfer flavoprotein subunit alpha/FixB family protein [Candidatus Paceibacterota bacterium]HRZ94122.1 electron transfer flavoprotein subunit alpha/FixB family protein [Candidatus Paceibacterota bacterium]